MRVGLLITSVGEFGQKGFYNSQEIGLAKELELLVDEVIIYKAVDIRAKYIKDKLEDCRNTILIQIPVKSIGTNGLWNCDEMDNTLDALIYFSDTQWAITNVYKWCQSNKVRLYPYIGIMKSHSTNKIYKLIKDKLLYRNIKVYQKCLCFVKTPYIKTILEKYKVKNLKLAPVGLDVTLLQKDYKNYSTKDLKAKWGYCVDNKILLFIGRMTEEKRPFEMIELFQRIYEKCQDYRMIMVGKGELFERMVKIVEKTEIPVRFIQQIPNQDIWELFCIADCFVNLNKQEIFGMALLEAMFYGCKVVAWTAPGPEFIIENGKSGYLAKSKDDIIEKITDDKIFSYAAHERVISNFTWKKTSEIMSKVIGNKEI